MALAEAECYELLQRIDQLWGAKIGTPEGAELDALVERVLQYEDFVFPVEPRTEDFSPDSGMTEEEYFKALARIEQLLEAKAGTPECNERLDLADLVGQYEEEHGIKLWPVDSSVQADGLGSRSPLNLAKIVCAGIRIRAQRRLAEADGTALTENPWTVAERNAPMSASEALPPSLEKANGLGRRRLRPEDFPADSGMTEEGIAVFGEEVDRAAAHFRAKWARVVAYGAAVYRAHQRFHANMDRIEAAAAKWRPQPACPVCGTERMRRNWYGYWVCMACDQNEWMPDGARQLPRDRSAVDAMDHFMVVCQAVSEIRMVLSRLEPHHLNQLQCELLELLEASQVLLLEPNLYRSEQRSVLDEYLEQARSILAEADDAVPQMEPIPRRKAEDD